MWVVSRETVDFYSALMVVIETADAPESVLRIRHEWRALCDTYSDLPALNRETLARGTQTDTETVRFAQAHESVNSFCKQWYLCDAAEVIPTALYVLLLSGETDLRRAHFVVWDFTRAAPQPPNAKLPFPVWAYPQIESLDEFLQRVRATLRVEQRPELLQRLDTLPARPVLVMEWDAEQQRFVPRPPDWVQRFTAHIKLPHYTWHSTIENTLLEVCEAYFSLLKQHITISGANCYKPPFREHTRRLEYYTRLAWVHLLRNVCKWEWKRIEEFLCEQGVVMYDSMDEYYKVSQLLRKAPEKIRALGLGI